MVGDRGDWISMFPEHTSDSHSVVARFGVDLGAVGPGPTAMPDARRWLEMDDMTERDRAQQIVRLFAGSPRASRAYAQRFVKPCVFHERAPQEHGECDRTPPHVLASDGPAPAVPSASGCKPWRHNFAPRQ